MFIICIHSLSGYLYFEMQKPKCIEKMLSDFRSLSIK
jgi:hypothetical protein